ncbi:diacylglycerol kinase family protein [Candidatus Pelagibacter bacterium]|nr:diacylglycerol kinase family protein [Candidatus Pelagibacter bacterium]
MKNKFKFIIIFNQTNITDRKDKKVNKILELLKIDHEVEIFKSYTEVEAKDIYKNLKQKKFDRLIVAGGDGSFSLAINEIIKNDLNEKLIGFIPIGTANILKFEARINNKVNDIYKVLVSENFKKVNLAKINDRYFFLMAGIGFDSKIVKSVTNQLKKYLGKIIFILKGLQYFLFIKNNKMKIDIDNEEVLADWILCANSKYYAGSYNITKETDIFDSKLIAFIFEDLTRLKLLQYIFLILTKGDLSSAKSVIKKDFEEIKIFRINDKLLSQVDGENCGFDERIIIKKTKKFVNLLVP